MRREIVYCDICKKEIPQRGWEDAPTMVRIHTHCAYQNPMAEHAQGFQDNDFVSADTCQTCQREIAKVVSETLTRIKNQERKEPTP